MARKKEKGIALIFSLLGIIVVSLLATGLLFVSNQETFSALNYQKQVQAVYASTMGVQSALDWFRNTYAPYLDNQATGVVDTAVYTLTGASPVYSGAGVTLGGAGANFPSTTIKTSFNTMRAPAAAVAIGNAGENFTLTGSLLSHTRYKDVTGNNVMIAERWQISVTGTIPNPIGGGYTVAEVAIIERFFIPIFKDALRGQCNVGVAGNVTTDSFNSQNCKSPPCAYGGSNLYTGADAGSNVGSNAVLVLTGGSITVNGNAYYGQTFGTCTGTDKIPSGDVKGTVTEAPAVPFPPITPTFTTTTGGTTICSAASWNVKSGPTKGNYYAINPNTTGTYYGSCSLSSDNLVLCLPQGTTAAQPFFMTDLGIVTNGSIVLMQETKAGSGCNSSSNVCGSAGTSCPPAKVYVSNTFKLSGNGSGSGSLANTDDTLLTVLLTGTDTTDDNLCDWGGNSPFYGTIYSPNAACNFHGTGDLYGAASAWNIDAKGNFNVHYDLALSAKSGYVTTFRIVNQTRSVF